MNLAQFGLALYRRYPALFAGNLVLSLMLALVDAATLASIAPVVSLLTGGGTDSVSPIVTSAMAFFDFSGGVELYLSIFVVLTICNSLLLIAINYFILRAQFHVRGDMLMTAAEQIVFTSTNFLNQKRQGDFLNALTQEVGRIADSFTAMTRMVAPASQAVVLLGVPLYISWQVTCGAMLLAFFLMMPLRLARKKGYLLGKNHTESSNEFATALQESLANLRLIAGFSREGGTLSRLTAAFERVRVASIRMQLLQAVVQLTYTPIGIIVVFATFLLGRHLGVELAEIAVILYAFNRLTGTLANLNQSKIQLYTMYPSYEHVMQIITEADAARLRFGARPFKTLDKEIRIKDVSFSYGNNVPALDGIDFSIPAGTMTALVGASGSGKSTLADLVLGLQQPTAGKILIDGIPFDELDIQAFRAHLGYVPQHTALFHGTIRSNILWAKPDASEEEIREACRMASIETLIDSLPDGLDTVVGDRGLRLSGGQVQRIALARALIRKPSLIILDEATSALDSESEFLIQSAIEAIRGQTTILVIAHRLSTIMKADNIIVLDAGRIVEQGTFTSLNENGGTFSRLVELQKL